MPITVERFDFLLGLRFLFPNLPTGGHFVRIFSIFSQMRICTAHVW